MPIVFSNSAIIYTVIGPFASAAALVSGLHTVFTSAGWPSAAITGGYEYMLTSPRGLQVKVKLYDPADANGWAIVQMKSAVDGALGVAHKLNSTAVTEESSTQKFSVWANICQFFIGPNETSATPRYGGNAVAGGVPEPLGLSWDTSLCGELPPGAVTEDWWSCGDEKATGTFYVFGGDGISFRNSYICTSWWDARYNGTLLSYTDNAHLSASDLQLVPARPPLDVGNFSNGLIFYHPPDPVFVDWPLEVEPYIAWAQPGLPPVLRGQLYDAVVVSQPWNADKAVRTFEHDDNLNEDYYADWRNYLKVYGQANQPTTYVSYFTSLLLFISATPIAVSQPQGNYVY